MKKAVTLDGEHDLFVSCVDPEFSDSDDIDDTVVTASVEWVPDAHRLIVYIDRPTDAAGEPTVEFHSTVPVVNHDFGAISDDLVAWLEDALSRNQIVHSIDRQRARTFVAALRKGAS